MQETRVRSLGGEDSLEKEMATHSGTLAWKIPRTEEHGGLQSMGLQSRTQLSDFTFTMKLFNSYRVAQKRLISERGSIWWSVDVLNAATAENYTFQGPV